MCYVRVFVCSGNVGVTGVRNGNVGLYVIPCVAMKCNCVFIHKTLEQVVHIFPTAK